jgi:hypothetical protein
MRRAGPALIGAVCATWALFLLLPMASVTSLTLGVVSAGLAVPFFARAVGPQELLVDRDGLHISRGLTRLGVPWSSIAGMSTRIDRPSPGTVHQGANLLITLMRAANLRQEVVVISIKPSHAVSARGIGQVVRAIRRAIGSPNPVTINTAEFRPDEAEVVYPTIHEMWKRASVGS